MLSSLSIPMSDSILLLLTDICWNSYLAWFLVMVFGVFYFFFFLVLNEFIFVFHFFNRRMTRYSSYFSQYSAGSILLKLRLGVFFLID